MSNPSRVAFTLFGREIYWYGVLMALGIVIAAIFVMRECKRKKMPEDLALDICLVAIPSGIVGARLYYVAFELERYLQNPISILYIWEGGLGFYGAFIGGLVGILIYCKVKKIRFLKVADMIAPGLVLAQAIGRWGNFFNQEAFGLPVTDPNLLWFPLTVKIDTPWMNPAGYHLFNGVPCDNPYHLATFFYESLWCFLVFLVLWFLIRKRVKHDGDVLLWYVMLYGFERMFVEGLRGDSLWLIPGAVRVSQALAALLFLGVLAFFLLRRAREKKLGMLIWPSPEVIPEAVGAGETIEAETQEAVTDKPVDVEETLETGADEPVETAEAQEQAEEMPEEAPEEPEKNENDETEEPEKNENDETDGE